MKRIERELASEDLGVRKPTVKDKLKAAATNAYQSNDVAKAKKIQDQLDRKLALESIKRRAKKAPKCILKQCGERIDTQPKRVRSKFRQ